MKRCEKKAEGVKKKKNETGQIWKTPLRTKSKG